MARETSGSITTSSMLKGKLALLVSFVLPALVVIGFLFLLISLRNGAEAAVANLANLLPVGYAFAAGMVASVNPCGFFMLPSYISYHLGTEEAGFYEAHVANRLGKALLLGGMATAGFLVVFAAIGSIISIGGYWLATVFPYAGVGIGVVMVGLGLWLLLTHRTIGIMAASRVVVSPQRNLRNVFLFGIGYATCSLSCTLPVFLVVEELSSVVDAYHIGKSSFTKTVQNVSLAFFFNGVGVPAAMTGFVHPVWAKFSRWACCSARKVRPSGAATPRRAQSSSW